VDLVIKCVVAGIIMGIVHYISKTDNYYIAGLVLSFPGLSILAYYFMYVEHGASKVRETISFAMVSVISFVIFLLVLKIALKNYNILNSLLVSSVVWGVISTLLIITWKKFS